MSPRTLLFRAFTFLWIAAACTDEDATGAAATLVDGEFCDPGFASDCPVRRCEDVVGGESCDGISCTDWGQPANQGTVCTRPCRSDQDCASLRFAAVNGEQVASEVWFCASSACHVLVTAPEGQAGDVCTGCGGIFCSGRCIGCPQC